jgi:hypothetical protein
MSDAIPTFRFFAFMTCLGTVLLSASFYLHAAYEELPLEYRCRLLSSCRQQPSRGVKKRVCFIY